ncbi:MAG: hypothetical protein Q9220_002660 [cf. Caloplaca sp. 1 TL-2023]
MAQQYANQQPSGFQNHIKNVAIVGAAGWSGSYMVQEILKLGKQTVTAITREGSKNAMPAGVQVKKVNYDDTASLVEALKGQDALIITMGTRAPPDQQNKLIEAAAEAGVPWVLPNEFGNDNDNEKLRNENIVGAHSVKYRALIEKLGKSSWVAVSCGFWYEFSLGGGPERYGFDFKNRSVTFFDQGTQPLSTSTWAQNGRGVASLLNLKILRDDESDNSPCLTDWKNKFAYIASFVVTQQEMFESVLRATGTTKEDWKITHEDSKERYGKGMEMFKSGNFLGMAIVMYTRGFYPSGDANFSVTRGLDNEKLGLPKENFDERTKAAVELALDGTLSTYGS